MEFCAAYRLTYTVRKRDGEGRRQRGMDGVRERERETMTEACQERHGHIISRWVIWTEKL